MDKPELPKLKKIFSLLSNEVKNLLKNANVNLASTLNAIIKETLSSTDFDEDNVPLTELKF